MEDFGRVKAAVSIRKRRVVFNIRGNEYRLVVAINFSYGIVFVKWLGTHREYDCIDVREVEYDEDRYTGLSGAD